MMPTTAGVQPCHLFGQVDCFLPGFRKSLRQTRDIVGVVGRNTTPFHRCLDQKLGGVGVRFQQVTARLKAIIPKFFNDDFLDGPDGVF